MIQHERPKGNRPASRIILAAGAASTVLYGLAAGADLLQHRALHLGLHAALLALMLVAWRQTARVPATMRWIVIGAVVFRLIAAVGAPTLSDDVYRYVWDGRVQAHGIHPYAHAPDDPALESLRDDDWSRINHPELRTIYPPLAQMLFAALAWVGAGPWGFKLAFALADLGVVAALAALLRRCELPPDRLVLYAWNPLAVIETAGAGHVEPVGVALVVVCAAWVVARRMKPAALVLAGAVHVKLLPLVLIPGLIRRWRNLALLVLALGLLLPALPYALTGPAIGTGLFDYAERWERNASLYHGIEQALERIDTGPRLKPLIGDLRKRFGRSDAVWNRLYANIWPRELARLIVGLLAVIWVVSLSFRRGLTAPREIFLALAGVLLLSPTLHPWYVLWVLPFAAAYVSVPWLALAALVPLAYLGGDDDVAESIRAIEYGIPLLLALASWWRTRTRPPLD